MSFISLQDKEILRIIAAYFYGSAQYSNQKIGPIAQLVRALDS